MKRFAAWVLYQKGPVCFACGRRGDHPCAGHEYGGTIIQSRRRRYAPFFLTRYVDCRWSW